MVCGIVGWSTPSHLYVICTCTLYIVHVLMVICTYTFISSLCGNSMYNISISNSTLCCICFSIYNNICSTMYTVCTCTM